jgi:hypothetical protein
VSHPLLVPLGGAGAGMLRDPADLPAVGEVHGPAGLVTTGTPAYGSGVNSTLFLTPLNVWQGATYNAVSVNVATARVAGTSGNLRLGLYGSTADGSRPDLTKLLFDWGQLDLGTTTGVKSLSPTAFALTPGRFWLAAAYQIVGTPTTYPQPTTIGNGLITPQTAFPTALSRCWTVGSVSGALPTSGTLAASSTGAPVVCLTRSA